jgi:outer membrane cobalamin receptor
MRSRPGRSGAEHARLGRTARSLALAALLAAQARSARAQDAQYETTVVAPRAPEAALEDDAASASVITSDRTPRSGETLPQLLSELPGLSVTRLGGLGAMATLSLRGSAANQVLVYVDGIPLNSATWGSVDIGALPIADLDRIEVYRGMSPTSFGASAIGGIVSLTSRTPEVTGASAYAGGGTFGTGFGGAQATWAVRRVRLMLSANYLRSRGDFDYFGNGHTAANPDDNVPDRIRQNNTLAQLDGLARAAVPLPGRRELLATLSFFGRDKGLAPYGEFQAQGASLGLRRFLGSVLYESRDDLGAGGRLRVTAYGGTTQVQLVDLNREFTSRPTSNRDRATAVGATATASRPLTGWLGLAATADARRETFAPFDLMGTDPSGPPGTRTSGALGTEAHLLLGGLEVLPSFRLEAAHDEIIDYRLEQYADLTRPQTHLLPVARLAFLHRRDWLTLRANVGRYGRVPTMFERYGDTGLTHPNPALVPERGYNGDAGFTAAVGAPEQTGLQVDGALFAAHVRNLIDMQPGRGFQRAANVGAARVLGAELAVLGRLGRHARLTAQGTFTDARDVSDVPAYHGMQLVLRPRLRAYARPEARGLPLPFGLRLGLHGDVAVVGSNYLDPSNRISLRRRVLLGAGADLETRDGRWRLVVTAQNLASADVVDLAGFPHPRRSIFFTLQWSSSGNSPSKESVP